MITVGTTLAAYKMTGDPRNAMSWLSNAEAVQASVDDDVRYFVALETDARGLEPFRPLLDRLNQIGGARWQFSLDDGATVITGANRVRRICIGQNLVGDYAINAQASHVLFLASDVQVRDDVLPRLLELDAPVTACHVPTYGFGSQFLPIPEYAANGWDVRSHMETCCAMMLRRDVFSRLRWRYDLDRGMTDDPSMFADVTELLHEQVLSRHDVIATHYPASVPSIEDRHSDEQRRIHR